MLSGEVGFEDYLDELSSSSYFLPPSLELEQPLGMWSRHGPDLRGGQSKSSSRFPSRFPSLAPEHREESGGGPGGGSGMVDSAAGGGGGSGGVSMRAPSSLRILPHEHNVMKSRLEEFSSVLPPDFVFPSRYTATRFLEGYIGGFHEYLPFLHVPTLSVTDMSPELLLAILAVGAQYRFESPRGNALWYAARAVALEQVRRRQSHEVHGLLPTPAAYSPHSTRPSPSAGHRHTFASAQMERPTTQETHREP